MRTVRQEVLNFGLLLSVACAVSINALKENIPDNCLTTLSVEGVRVHCINPIGIPAGLQNNTRELKLSCNHETRADNNDRAVFNVLQRRGISHLQNLEYFEINGCPIHKIEDGFFYNLATLKTVLIVNASIINFNRGIFEKSSSLAILQIIDCPVLKYIDDNLLISLPNVQNITLVNTNLSWSNIHQFLSGGVKNLRQLTIANQKQPIERGFDLSNDQMFQLKYFNLSNNKVKNISLLHHIKTDELILSGCNFIKKLNWQQYPELTENLIKLDLSQTSLDHLRFSAKQNDFPKLPKLTHLILNDNMIQQLPWEYLSGINDWTPNLKVLDLRQNHITTLPSNVGTRPNVVIRISELDLRLEDNPIHCNCEFNWLHESDDSVLNKAIARIRQILPCYTVAIESSDRGFYQEISKQTYEEYIKSNSSVKFACLSPAEPYVSFYQGSQLQRTFQKDDSDYKITTGNRSKIYLQCNSYGDPEPYIEWRESKTNRKLSNSKITHQRGPTMQSSKAVLTIEKKLVSKSSEPQLQVYCVASNVLGQSISKLTVQLENPLLAHIKRTATTDGLQNIHGIEDTKTMNRENLDKTNDASVKRNIAAYIFFILYIVT